MYQAVCAECGRDCEVPFQPTGDKPVYCSTCFGNKGGNERRSNDRDSGRRDFGRSEFRENRKFSAICDKCGKQCEVPFRPTEGKPVFCDTCFTRPERDNQGAKREGPTNAEQLATLNAKLDNITKALIAGGLMTAPKKEDKPKEVKAVKEVKAEKEPAAKKAKAAKKTSKKK
jgi:CxxC-x17-CxxC domain-containing protein